MVYVDPQEICANDLTGLSKQEVKYSWWWSITEEWLVNQMSGLEAADMVYASPQETRAGDAMVVPKAGVKVFRMAADNKAANVLMEQVT